MLTLGTVCQELIPIYLFAARALDPTLELAPNLQIHGNCISDIRKGIQLLKEAQEIYAFSVQDFGQSKPIEANTSLETLLKALERAHAQITAVYQPDVSFSVKMIEDCLIKSFKGKPNTQLSMAMVELGLLNQAMDHFKIQMHVLKGAIENNESESNVGIHIRNMTREFKQASMAHLLRIQDILDHETPLVDKEAEIASPDEANKEEQGPESTFVFPMKESPLKAEAEYFEAHVTAQEEDAPRKTRTKLAQKPRSNDTPSPFQMMQELQSVLLSRSSSSTRMPN